MKSMKYVRGDKARVPGKNPPRTDNRIKHSQGRYSETLKEEILAYFLANPKAKTGDCHRDTGRHKSTITGVRKELKEEGRL